MIALPGETPRSPGDDRPRAGHVGHRARAEHAERRRRAQVDRRGLSAEGPQCDPNYCEYMQLHDVISPPLRVGPRNPVVILLRSSK